MRTARRGRGWDRIRTAFVPRRSALRRPSDRAETVARWVALVLLVLTVPFLLAAGSAQAQDVRDTSAHTRATAHEVVGTVVSARARPSRSADGSPSGAVDVTVAWTDPDGSGHVADDVSYTGTATGRPWPMWIDASGHRVRAPASETDAVVQGALLVVLLLTGATTALVGALALLRWVLDRGRLRQWDDDWAAFRRGRDRGVTG